MRRSFAAGVVQEIPSSQPEIPLPLRGGKLVETCTLKDVPSTEHLKEWLLAKGLDTSDWGLGNTKEVSKFWHELEGDESGLELWRKASGELQAVRTTHVLRAKVCSPESFQRNIFVLNTWQQYGDGRKRVRNGLLSEKLTISEMPLENNLVDVCRRAVTEEEMQYVADPLLKIGPKSPAPKYDPTYVCPLEVTDQYFEDHVIEIEESKSYPRLLTMYHLYTVSILCTGLPAQDFNTLEFDHDHGDGNRPLKYVHAWVWMKWHEIQRYLFEGSKLKERKGKGSFQSIDTFTSWLGNFNLDVSSWDGKSVDELYHELEKQECHLELWGRSDGVPLLMRVAHVLQLKVTSSDTRLKGKFIAHVWTEKQDGTSKPVGRLMATRLAIVNTPFDKQRFFDEAKKVIDSHLTYIVDPHFTLDPDTPPVVRELELSAVIPSNITFVDHRVDVVDSRTYKGLCTLYHLYLCEVECEGLPLANFASVEVSDEKVEGAKRKQVEPYVRSAYGWDWVTWPQCLDMIHLRVSNLEDSCDLQAEALSGQDKSTQDTLIAYEELLADMRKLASDPAASAPVKNKAQAAVTKAEQARKKLGVGRDSVFQRNIFENNNAKLPPSMVSEMGQDMLAVEECFYKQDDSPSKGGPEIVGDLKAARGGTMEVMPILESEQRGQVSGIARLFGCCQG